MLDQAIRTATSPAGRSVAANSRTPRSTRSSSWRSATKARNVEGIAVTARSLRRGHAAPSRAPPRGLTLGALILLFAAYAIVDGVSHVVTGIRQRSGERPDGLMILGGVVGIAVGVVAAILPGITALFLLALIGAWAIVTGAAEIFAAYRLRKAIRGEWLL